MPDTVTPEFLLVKPEITGSADTWGNKLNGDMDKIEAALSSMVPRAGGTGKKLTGAIIAADDTALLSRAQVLAIVNAVVPIGTVVMWAGTHDNVPAGWSLCTGQVVNGNTTPNLQDRFIVASSLTGNYQPGEFGGTSTHSHAIQVYGTTLTIGHLPAHTHSYSDPGHAHTYGDPTHQHVTTIASVGSVDGYFGGGSALGVPSGSYGAVSSASATGIIIHGSGVGITINNTGSNTPHDHPASSDSQFHIPPYYCLAFIMKTSLAT